MRGHKKGYMKSTGGTLGRQRKAKWRNLWDWIAVEGSILLFHWWVQSSPHLIFIREQWGVAWSYALVPGVVPVRGLETKITGTFQRSAILEAQEQRTRPHSRQTDLCQGRYRPGICLPSQTCPASNLQLDHPVGLILVTRLVRPATWPPELIRSITLPLLHSQADPI